MRLRGTVLGLFVAFAVSAPASTTAVPVVVEYLSANVALPAHPAGMTPDGRYVLFYSGWPSPVPESDAFVHDRQTGITEQVSVDAGAGLYPFTYGTGISDDGRFVVMESNEDFFTLSGPQHVFVRDVQAGTTTLATPGVNGGLANGISFESIISGDGRFIFFSSLASDLVPDDNNGHEDVFAYHVETGQIERVSVDASGGDANSVSGSPASSDDGRYVAFNSSATDLLPGGNPRGAFVRDMQAGVTELVLPDVGLVDMSGDGRHVLYMSSIDGVDRLYAYDRQTQVHELVSVDRSGRKANAGAGRGASISNDGRFVTFTSGASGMVGLDDNGAEDAFVRDRLVGWTSRVSFDGPGASGYGVVTSGGSSGDGRYVAFSSNWQLSPLDTDDLSDAYVRDQDDADGVDWALDNCPVVANTGQSDVDGDGAGDACDDSDHDGCTDAAEESATPGLGGARDREDFWDFFDVPVKDHSVEAKMGRDFVVSISDIGQLVLRFGSAGDSLMDPLSRVPLVVVFPGEPVPLSLLYHTAYDRTVTGPNMWNSGPPNGSITIQDLAIMVAQFGHSCA